MASALIDLANLFDDTYVTQDRDADINQAVHEEVSSRLRAAYVGLAYYLAKALDKTESDALLTAVERDGRKKKLN
jgi:hypothetical protein